MSYLQDLQFAQSVKPNYMNAGSLYSTNTSSESSSGGDSGEMSGQTASKAAMLAALGAQRTYEEGKQRLAASMSQRKNALKGNYNSSLESLKSDYDLSSKNINDTASGSLKQAYINNMMSQKNLKQKMASQGLTGGATESTLARLINAYGNNRNNIDTQKNKDLSSLENAYTNNKSKALQDYNNALAQLEAENFQALSNLDNTYYDRLNQAIADYANSGFASDSMLNSALAGYAGAYGYYGTPAMYGNAGMFMR